MSSSILPWQHAQWRLIDEMRSIQRLPHALLIKGPPGVGKGRFAERLASLLLCHQPENAPCGSCRSCELSVSGAHPDLRVVVPENESATIGVDQIRALISAFAFTPALGSRKMGVITPAENMTTAAANSPPQNSGGTTRRRDVDLDRDHCGVVATNCSESMSKRLIFPPCRHARAAPG